MKYEVIIFDADETLFDFKKSEKYAFENAMLEFGMKYDENHHLPIYHSINKAIWGEFDTGLITQEELKAERFRRFSKELKLDFDEVAFAATYARHLSDASYLYDNITELIASLHETYRLIIVTNGLSSVQENRIKKSVISGYFEDIIVSEEVGLSKPDPRIFELALSNIRYTDKSKVLIVGDSLITDIQGGTNSGIDTCWYNPKRKENATGILPTYEIESFSQLADILEK
ncbi:MAG TPA: YjjG family noncanonical pyrimidine nucleotidase [Negativicutes bacterium]|nr:YjjG family noncanonical pyrimidine nucleotidase [Negativicutes bacterium]